MRTYCSFYSKTLPPIVTVRCYTSDKSNWKINWMNIVCRSALFEPIWKVKSYLGQESKLLPRLFCCIYTVILRLWNSLYINKEITFHSTVLFQYNRSLKGSFQLPTRSGREKRLYYYYFFVSIPFTPHDRTFQRKPFLQLCRIEKLFLFLPDNYTIPFYKETHLYHPWGWLRVNYDICN